MKNVARRLFKTSGLEKVVRSVGNNKLIRQVTLLAGGAAAAHAINMLFYPFLTRIYGPEGYGAQSVFMTTATLIATVSALSYPLAIVLPKENQVAAGLGRMSLMLGVGASILAALLCLFFSENLFGGNEGVGAGYGYAIAMPISVFVIVLTTVATQWLVRYKSFKLISKITVLAAIFSGLLKASIGLASPTAITLILVTAAAGALSAMAMYFFWKKSHAEQSIALRDKKWSAAFYWDVAVQYRDFATLRTPQNFIVIASQSVPIYFLSYFFGAGQVGFYSLASTILAVPAAVVGGSAMHVFYPRLSEMHRAGGDCAQLLRKATIGMLGAGILPFGIIGIFGPYLFDFVFGDAWSVAGDYARWLSLAALSTFVSRPAINALVVFRLQGQLLVLEVISMLLKLGLLYITQIYFGDDVLAIGAFSLVSVFHGIALIVAASWSARYRRSGVHS